MSDLDLDAIEANARHWDHLVRDDPETTLALVAEVRLLRAQVSRVEALADGLDHSPSCVAGLDARLVQEDIRAALEADNERKRS